MAISTFGVTLMHSATGTGYEKLINIKDFPDMGGEPEMLETTTLSDEMQTYIAGIQSLDALTFATNYTKEDYQKLMALAGKTEYYAVWFGVNPTSKEPTGENGKFSFKGQLSAFPTGGGVNEVVGMTVSIAPSTPIKLETETP